MIVSRLKLSVFLVLLAAPWLGCGRAVLLTGDPTPRVGVSGRVVDAMSQRPIPQAEILVGGTALRATSDASGVFALPKVPLGHHTVIVVTPDYGTAILPLAVDPAGRADVVLRVARDEEEQASSIAEEAYDDPEDYAEALRRENRLLRRRLAQYKRLYEQAVEQPGGRALFERLYAGTEVVPACALLNPEVLRFESKESSGGFTSTTVAADEPLVVENRWLGYRVRVALVDFTMTQRRRGHSVRHDNVVAFEALAPRNDDEAGRWAKNRLKVYRGSLQHFLTALAARRAEREGFRVYAGTFVDDASTYGSSFSRAYDIEVDPAPYVATTEHPYERSLALVEELKVTFPTQVLVDDTDFVGVSMGDQTSWLRVQQSPVPFTTDGRLLEPERVRLSGYWSIRRLCQMLPQGWSPVISHQSSIIGKNTDDG